MFREVGLQLSQLRIFAKKQQITGEEDNDSAGNLKMRNYKVSTLPFLTFTIKGIG